MGGILCGYKIGCSCSVFFQLISWANPIKSSMIIMIRESRMLNSFDLPCQMISVWSLPLFSQEGNLRDLISACRVGNSIVNARAVGYLVEERFQSLSGTTRKKRNLFSTCRKSFSSSWMIAPTLPTLPKVGKLARSLGWNAWDGGAIMSIMTMLVTSLKDRFAEHLALSWEHLSEPLYSLELSTTS